MHRLANITNNLIGQPMFNLMARAQEMESVGEKVMHFEIGDPDFNSPSDAKEAAIQSINDNLTHYTNSMGLMEFREKVADYVDLNWGFKPSLNQILISPANAVIDFATRCILNPGEEVIFPDPGFPTYYSVINYCGMIPVGIQLNEENSFRMNPDDIRDRISKRTKLIIINTPHNPTGSVMQEEEILEIVEIAEEYDLYLLSDEVYAKIIFEGKHFSPSIVDKCKERVILLFSLSKVYSMSGWRLGFAVGPDKLIEKMGLLLQTIFSCLPPFLQVGGIAALSGDQRFQLQMVDTLRKRRDTLIKGLNELSGVSCLAPDGAFYAFPNIMKSGMTSDEYSEKMLNEVGVCLLPGNCFGKYGDGYVRLSYANMATEMIEEAIEKMKIFHQKYI